MALDLRFVPDGSSFGRKPSEKCTSVSQKDREESKVFATQALAHSNVKLTWDQPVKRDTEKLFKRDDIRGEQLNTLVALESSDDEEDGGPSKPAPVKLTLDNDGGSLRRFQKRQKKGPQGRVQSRLRWTRPPPSPPAPKSGSTTHSSPSTETPKKRTPVRKMNFWCRNRPKKATKIAERTDSGGPTEKGRQKSPV